MAVIHHTTMTPGKLELLTSWLPRQPWYEAKSQPRLEKVGGFRLDDPAGEVGIECMIVADLADDDVAVYFLPLAYRGSPLPGADSALIGTSEHGVLGLRWIYDGACDPVVLAQLRALCVGDATAQAQSESNTRDATVLVVSARDGGSTAAALAQAEVTIVRVLSTPIPDAELTGAVAHVSTGWQLPDGSRQTGLVLALQPLTPR